MRAKTAPRFPSVERCSFSYMFFVGLMETRYLTPWSGLRSMSRGESDRDKEWRGISPAPTFNIQPPKSREAPTSNLQTSQEIVVNWTFRLEHSLDVGSWRLEVLSDKH